MLINGDIDNKYFKKSFFMIYNVRLTQEKPNRRGVEL